MNPCPVCGVTQNDNMSIKISGKIYEHGCFNCWIENVFTDIKMERIWQKDKWRDYPIKSMAEYLPVLIEEVGEVATEIYDNIYLDKSLNDCKTELIQVAAVCIGMIEKAEELMRQKEIEEQEENGE